MRASMLPVVLLFVGSALAAKTSVGGSCSQLNNRLNQETYQFTSDCTATGYCTSEGVCREKKCRRDEYPYGYPQYSDNLPKMCGEGTFCPDEEDGCLPQLAVGELCQLNRDDQCAPPENSQELAGPRNNKGSICLNYRCQYANVTLGQTCIVENTPYYAFASGSGNPFINVVSRGNCVNGLYCDSVKLTCMAQLEKGATCTGDKECQSNNCLAEGVCGNSPDASQHLGVYVYILVAIAIAIMMFGILGGLFFLHKKNRKEEREKRQQYWREQEQFRQNIMQMREQARASLLSLPWQGQPLSPGGGSKERDYPPSENSQTGILHAASQPSGLRNEYSDSPFDDDRDPSEEALVMRGAQPGVGGRRSTRRV